MPPNKEQRERLGEWLELADDIRYGRRDLVDGRHQRNPTTGGIGQGYERGSFACHLHIVLVDRGSGGTPCEYCAAFQRRPDASGELDVKEGSLESLAVNQHVAVGAKHGADGSVFVDIGKFPQLDERVKPTPVPSVVRLVPLNDCPMRGGDFVEIVTFPEQLGRVGDGKLNTRGLLGCVPVAFVEGKLPDHVVQSASQIVDEVPEDHCPTHDVPVRHGVNPEQVVAAFRIVLGPKTYLVAFDREKIDGFAIKGIAVRFCPFDLGPAAAKIGRVGHG